MANEHSSRLASVGGLVVVLALVVLGSRSALGATWYIDPTSTAGANSGASWADAWTNFSSIVWASVSAGDTIYLSGGTTSQTYNETFTFPKGGSSDGSRITLKTGQTAGHNGIAIIDGNYIDGRQNWITISGNVSGAQHLQLANFYNTSERTFGNAIFCNGTTGVRVEYCSFTNVNQCASFVGSQGFVVDNCTGTDIRGDAAVRAVNAPDNGYDSHTVSNNYFELSYCTNCPALVYGPDGVQGGNGITVTNNTFTLKKVGYYTSTQHPDYCQIIGNHTKICANRFINIGDSGIDFDLWANPTWNHVQVFNNLFQIFEDIDPGPEYIRLYSSSANMTALSDILIANNTFVDNPYANVFFQWKGNPTLTSFLYVNNIFVASSPYILSDNTTFDVQPPYFGNEVFYPSSSLISYRCAPFGGFVACNNYNATTWSAVESTRILGLPAFASYTYRSTNNDFHLAAGDTVARGAGMDLSAYFTTDKDGLTRSAPWAVGAYQGSAGADPGRIGIIASSFSVNETNGSVTITLRRSSGTTGAVGVSYATANGSATSGVNYTVASGTKSWANADSADKTVSVPILTEPFNGTKDFTFGIYGVTGGAALDTTTNATVVITGSLTNTILAGLSWPATNGTISSPFIVTNTYVVQLSQTTDPATAGRLTFTFTNSIGTNVVVKVNLDASGDAHNSVFVNFDSLPTTPAMISDILPYTTGFEDRVLSWRGTGSFDNNQYVPRIFNISTGLHTLILLGRESQVKLAQVTVEAPPVTDPPATPTNTYPANLATLIPPTFTFVGSAYSDPGSRPQVAAQFQIYSAATTTLLWDSQNIPASVICPSPRLDLNTAYFWTCRYQNDVHLWSPWSTLTLFQTRPGATLNVGTLNAGAVVIRN